jgi:hypothetical protein
VIVVPPTAQPASDRLHRLLVPLDGTGETAEAVQDVLGAIGAEADLELVALHVFDADSIPAFSDQFGHETEAWDDEFLRRWLPDDHGKTRLETRVGRVGDVVRAACEDADFVAVAWKQDLTPGRAQVVCALLADATVPVVLLPTRTRAAHPSRAS